MERRLGMRALLFFITLSIVLPTASAFALGSKPLHRTKRTNVQVSTGAPDFYFSGDTYSITIKNYGRLKTPAIVTTLPAGPFTISSDGCTGVELLPGATCALSVTYLHPGTYPQMRTLTLTGPGFYVDVGLNACDPMLC